MRGVRVRGTLRWDRFHRPESAKCDAIVSAGLSIIYLDADCEAWTMAEPWQSSGLEVSSQ